MEVKLSDLSKSYQEVVRIKEFKSAIQSWNGPQCCCAVWSSFTQQSVRVYGPDCISTYRRHQLETFSALLAICVGNSPVTGHLLGNAVIS